VISIETTYSFGDFEVRVAGGEITRVNERITLPPKVFELLVFFVENPGRLLSKKELLDGIWSNVYVEQGSLNRAVARLRAALGDRASSPQFIETVPRRGFRFIASVQRSRRNLAKAASPFQIQIGQQRYPLHEGDNSLGRSDECDVSLNSDSISRRHAVISIDAHAATIRDLGSKNGTFVEGRRIEAAVALRDRERVRLGSVNMTFSRVRTEQSTVTDFHDSGAVEE
jgi:DNA-binding winged helix-turn-helix (wHTH) protein